MDLTVGDLVNRFDQGEIRLPLMQRDYVWRPNKVVRLLDSLYRKWPIGSFYIWQTQDDAQPSKKKVGAVSTKKMDSFYGFLLDGQQRLTSLSLALQGEAAELPDQRAFFDLENEKFYLRNMKKTIAKRLAAGDPLIVPMSELIDLDDKSSEIFSKIEGIICSLREQDKLGNGREEEYRKRLYTVSEMLKRKAQYEEFEDDSENHAFELFSRLNKGGTSLAAGDVEAARLSAAATKKIVRPMQELVAEPQMRALGLNFVFLLRVLITIHKKNCAFSKLPMRWADDVDEIEAMWRKTEKALRAVVDFVRNEMGWRTRRWLPSTMALIPFAYLLARKDNCTISGGEVPSLKHYLLISGLRNVFRGSTETAVNKYVRAVDSASDSGESLATALLEKIPKVQRFKIKKEDIISTSGMYSSLMQGYLAFLFEKDAKSWLSGVTLRQIIHEQFSPIAVHHIFPKEFMHERVAINKLNTAANSRNPIMLSWPIKIRITLGRN